MHFEGGRKLALPVLSSVIIIVIILAFFSLNGIGKVSAIPHAELEIGEQESEFEDSFHIPLFYLAAFLGLLAAVTGVKNSTNKDLRKLVPLEIPRRFHRWISVAYYTVFLGTFALWGMQYYSAKGTIFHTTHGLLALITLIVAMLSIISGALMLRRPRSWRLVHWGLTVLGYLLLLATIVLGLGLED